MDFIMPPWMIVCNGLWWLLCFWMSNWLRCNKMGHAIAFIAMPMWHMCKALTIHENHDDDFEQWVLNKSVTPFKVLFWTCISIDAVMLMKCMLSWMVRAINTPFGKTLLWSSLGNTIHQASLRVVNPMFSSSLGNTIHRASLRVVNRAGVRLYTSCLALLS